jgi:hypothetical protein
LAIESLLVGDFMQMPPCRQRVSSNVRFSGIQEVAEWALPAGVFLSQDELAAFNQPVATIGLCGFPDSVIGLWVQIGDLALESIAGLTGELVYHCPIPPKGSITTRASALEFLQTNSRWHWQQMPDVYQALAQAHDRVKERMDAYAREQLAKVQQMQALLRSRRVGNSQQERGFGNVQAMPAHMLPAWSALKKVNSSYFAFKMKSDCESWVVMESAEHVGYYIVPGGGLVDGWDESLPPSFGRVDVERGVYVGEGPVGRGIELIRSLGVAASRIDSDAMAICNFIGWNSEQGDS